MKTWTITLQTELSKGALYDELISLKKRLQISSFFIEGYDAQEQEASADVESIRRQQGGVWIHEEFKEEPRNE